MTRNKTPAQRKAHAEDSAKRRAARSPERVASDKAKTKARRAARGEAELAADRLRWRVKHGIKNATGESLLGVCEICKKRGRLVCDHCHKTGEIRGWICNKCNRGLGMLGDTSEGLEAALRYLKS